MNLNATRRNPAWYLLVVGILCASILVPVALLTAALVIAIRNNPLNAPNLEYRKYEWGTVKNGQIWFPVFDSGPGSDFYRCRLKCLHLTSGQEFETGISKVGEVIRPVWKEDGFYAETQSQIYRINDGKLVDICETPPPHPNFDCDVFLYNRLLTSIVPRTEGGFRLIHCFDGEWSDGTTIPLFSLQVGWIMDENGQTRNYREIRPSNPSQNAPIAIAVFRLGEVLYMIQTGKSFELSFRVGLGDSDPSSQVNSETARSATWKEIIPFNLVQPSEASVVCNRDRLLAVGRVAWHLETAIGHRWTIRQFREGGEWVELKGLERLNSTNQLYLIGDPHGNYAYAVDVNTSWGSAAFYKIDADTVQPPFLVFNGRRYSYLGWWGGIIAGCLLAWLCHVVILVCGLRWLRRPNGRYLYAFGDQVVSLVSPCCRLRSGAVNIFLICAIVLPAIAIQIRLLHGFSFSGLTLNRLSEALREFEIDDWGEGRIFLRADLMMQYLASQFAYLPLMICEVMILFAAWIGIQFFWGKTPGEWLTRTRVVRSDLRECTLGSIIIRTLFYWIDLPLLLTPLPAFVSMAFSDELQRWGDRVADTIVIRK